MMDEPIPFALLADDTPIELVSIGGEAMLVVRVDGEPYPLPADFSAAVLGI